MAESDLIRGNVDTLILKVLYEGDRYGFDLIKQINARSGGQWEIKQPTLYACLKRLEKRGFVKSYWDGSESGGGRRKYYTLTESGQEVFLKYKDEYERTRDLFDGLITDDDTILPVDDFSDVEEDSYAVPKRRPRTSSPRKKKVSPAPVDNEDSVIPPTDTEGDPYNENVNTENESVETQPGPDEDNTEEETVNGEIDDTERFVQQSFLDDLTQDSLGGADVTEDQTEDTDGTTEPDNIQDEPEPDYVPEPETDNTTYVHRDSGDPRSIIDRLTGSYAGGESYSTARTHAPYERSDSVRRETPPPAPPAPVPAAEKPAVQPAAEKPVPVEDTDEESLASRAYREILGDLVERFDTSPAQGPSPQTLTEQAAAAIPAEEKLTSERLDTVVRSVSELGNNVQVREHNDSAKVYNRKYKYYSNRLMMTHYLTMCSIMFLLGLTLFLTFYAGLKMRLRYDYLMYIFAGLLPIIMFITSVVIFVTNPDKQKRADFNFKFSIIIRLVIMVQVFVIIYAVNLMFKMPTSFSVEYVPSLVIPAVYALFIPLSEVIFMALYKSGRYAVE